MHLGLALSWLICWGFSMRMEASRDSTGRCFFCSPIAFMRPLDLWGFVLVFPANFSGGKFSEDWASHAGKNVDDLVLGRFYFWNYENLGISDSSLDLIIGDLCRFSKSISGLKPISSFITFSRYNFSCKTFIFVTGGQLRLVFKPDKYGNNEAVIFRWWKITLTVWASLLQEYWHAMPCEYVAVSSWKCLRWRYYK